MKPIKLIMSGFGPYGDTAPEINFEDFEDKGLFLICGDTGAGKTTIFDAVCYALFGVASGIHRDVKNFRSDYAKDNVESFVKFYFSHQGKEYFVHRILPFERKKLRGSGTTKEDEKATLYCDGKPVAEKPTSVDKKINEILGVDVKQFKQIAMIAQGEFYQLLNAKTEQRTEILRTIFLTNPYNNMEYKLKDRHDEAKTKVDDLHKSIIQYLQSVNVEEDSEYYDQYLEISSRVNNAKSVWNVDEIIALIERMLEKDRENEEVLSAQIKLEEKVLEQCQKEEATAEQDNGLISRVEGLNQEQRVLEERKTTYEEMEKKLVRQKVATYTVKPGYDLLKTKEKELNDTRSSIEEQKTMLVKAKEKAVSAETQLKNCLEKEAGKDSLKSFIDKIKSQEQKYSERDKHIVELENLATKGEQLRKEDEKLKEADEKLKTEIEGLRTKLEELKGKPEELSNVKELLSRILVLKERLDAIVDKELQECSSRKTDMEKKYAEFQQAEIEFKDIDNKLHRAQSEYRHNYLGMLAESLVEGKECPLCGSTTHPVPAKKTSDTEVSEALITELESNFENAKIKNDKAYGAAVQAKTLYEQSVSSVKENMQWCLANELYGEKSYDEASCGEVSFDELAEAIKIEQLEIYKLYNEKEELRLFLDNACAQKNKTEESLNQAQGEKTQQLKEKLEEVTNNIHELEKSVSAKKATLKGFEELTYGNWEEAKQAMDAALKQVSDIEKSIEEATKAKSEADQQKVAIESAIETQTKTCQVQQKALDEIRLSFDKSLEANGFSDESDFLAYVISVEKISASENDIAKYKEAVSVNKAQLQQATKDAKGKVKKDLTELKEKLQAQDVKVKDIRKNHSAVEHRISSNNNILQSIMSQGTKLSKGQHEYSVYRKLYNLVKGNTGNGKITLEQYIQAEGFDSIIRAANRRLLPMSDGQYEMYRQDDSLGKKSNTFLDLVVRDNYTGHKRLVGDLSGGESFKASLSLALGLSDTVCSNMGGVQMDALFIDEGFGTLDRTSIENALQILLNLTDTNKLVGVISHREELIENIPQKIIVKKTGTGSEMTFESGV